jgi:DNA topoisomerase-3
MTKLLTTGATDLLDGFVSNKTRRKFKARLAWDAKESKVSFAFEPRPDRKFAAKKGAGGSLGGVVAAVAAAAAAQPLPAKKVAVKTAAKKTPVKKTPAKKVVAKKAAAGEE